MNIFLHELKAYRKTMFAWACSMAALAVLYIVMFINVGKDLENMFLNLSDTVKKLLSIYTDSLSTLEGFYSFVFVYVVLFGAIQAMNLGVSIISKEIRDKTADFLMTKPVSRDKVLSSKILAALATLILTNGLYLAITLPTAIAVDSEVNIKIFLMISATLFFVQLMFLSLGIIVAVIVGKIKSVISISLSTVFGFFIVGMLGSVIGDKAVRYITPFKYFDLDYIVRNSSYEISFVIIAILFICSSTAASYYLYVKKDIHAV